MVLKKGDLYPGDHISVDHFQCALPGRLYISREGMDSKDIIHDGAILWIMLLDICKSSTKYLLVRLIQLLPSLVLSMMILTMVSLSSHNILIMTCLLLLTSRTSFWPTSNRFVSVVWALPTRMEWQKAEYKQSSPCHTLCVFMMQCKVPQGTNTADL